MIEVNIFALHISLIEKNYDFVLSFVDSKRKEKALRFVYKNDRLLSLGAGYLLKKCLPKGDFFENNAGKPYLINGPYFNLSHSGEYVVMAVHSNKEVGIDIEKVDEKKLDGIKYVLNEEERKIKDLNTLFRIWSNKESLIKCLSTGLKDIKLADGLPLEGVRTSEGEDYYTKSMIYNGYSLSITLEGKEPFETKINTINVLEE